MPKVWTSHQFIYREFLHKFGFEINLNQYQNGLKNDRHNNPLRLANKNYDSSDISGLFYFILFISIIVMISIFTADYYFHIMSNPIIMVLLIIAVIAMIISGPIAGITDPNQDDYD